MIRNRFLALILCMAVMVCALSGCFGSTQAAEESDPAASSIVESGSDSQSDSAASADGSEAAVDPDQTSSGKTPASEDHGSEDTPPSEAASQNGERQDSPSQNSSGVSGFNYNEDTVLPEIEIPDAPSTAPAQGNNAEQPPASGSGDGFYFNDDGDLVLPEVP